MPLWRLFAGSHWLTDDEVHQLRQQTFARLRKVSRALSDWDAYERAQADPTAPKVPSPPTLGRDGLQDL